MKHVVYLEMILICFFQLFFLSVSGLAENPKKSSYVCKSGFLTYVISGIIYDSITHENPSNEYIADTLSDSQLRLKLRICSDSSEDLLKAGLSSTDEYFTRLDYLSFNLRKNIWLSDGDIILVCSNATFVRNYGIAPYLDFILIFNYDNRLKRQELVLTINDIVWKTGICLCKF